MPKYDYKCPECGFEEEIEHSIAECDKIYLCMYGQHPDARMYRVMNTLPVYFFGPGFACNDGVARPNVGRNPHNQNRHSK